MSGMNFVDRVEYIKNNVDNTLNAFNTENGWTKEHLANIMIFLNEHYRVQYHLPNYITIHDLDNNLVTVCHTYVEFIYWYNDLVEKRK